MMSAEACTKNLFLMKGCGNVSQEEQEADAKRQAADARAADAKRKLAEVEQQKKEEKARMRQEIEERKKAHAKRAVLVEAGMEAETAAKETAKEERLRKAAEREDRIRAQKKAEVRLPLRARFVRVPLRSLVWLYTLDVDLSVCVSTAGGAREESCGKGRPGSAAKGSACRRGRGAETDRI